MEKEILNKIIEYVASAIEITAIIVIAGSVFVNLIKALLKLNSGSSTVFQICKTKIGKSLQLGLELLIAADVIKTITIEFTLENIVTLGVLVIVRTFLSWSIIIEEDERLPWQPGKKEQIPE